MSWCQLGVGPPATTMLTIQFNALRRRQMTAMASQNTGQSSVCSTVCSDWEQKQQRSALLSLCEEKPHPDDLAIPSISSGWLIVDAYVIRMTYLALVSHPDELRQIHYVIRMTYSSILCHPDDLTEVGFSSGWVTAMLLCHPDEIRFLS